MGFLGGAISSNEENVRRCWAFVSVGVGECQSDSFVCFGAKPTQRTCSQEEDEEAKVPEQNRRRQSAEESSQQKSGREPTVRERRLRGPVNRGRVGEGERTSQHSRWLCRNLARIHARDSPQMYRKLHKSVTNFSLLALGANPSS